MDCQPLASCGKLESSACNWRTARNGSTDASKSGSDKNGGPPSSNHRRCEGVVGLQAPKQSPQVNLLHRSLPPFSSMVRKKNPCVRTLCWLQRGSSMGCNSGSTLNIQSLCQTSRFLLLCCGVSCLGIGHIIQHIALSRVRDVILT